MIDKKTAESWLEGLTQDDWESFHSSSEVQEIAKAALELIRYQNMHIETFLKEKKRDSVPIEQDLLDLMVEYLCTDHSNVQLIELATKAIRYSNGQ